MRVLHVTRPQPEGEIGGADTQLLQLASAQAAAGWNVCVSCFGNSTFASRLQEAGVETFVRPEDSLRRWLSQVLRIESTFRPDIVHSHGYKADYVAAALKIQRRNVNLVMTAHGFVATSLRLKWMTFVNLLALRVADGVICASRESQTRVATYVGERATYVPNGVRPFEYRVQRYAFRAPVRLLYVGRLSSEKRVDLALHALAILVGAGLRAHLTVVGAGPQAAELAVLAGELGVTRDVTFAGFQSDVSSFYCCADILICASDTEGTPRCILEALLAGTVVVATSVGGVPELLGGGAGGRLVPPGSAASIADAIQEVIGMSLHDVTQLREHGFELAMSEFSFSRMVIGVEKVYGLVLQKLPTQEIKWTT